MAAKDTDTKPTETKGAEVKSTTVASVDKLDQEARAAEVKAVELQQAADEAKLSDEERRVIEAKREADNARAKADDARSKAREEATTEPTTAVEAKAETAVLDPERKIGEHLVQRFANTPENPPPLPGLDPNTPDEQKVRLELTDSDHPDPDNPKVCYVHEVMVGDYLRAGWRRPVA